jgi:hypothetical protein
MRHFARSEKRGNALRVVADNQANDAIIRDRINRSMRRRMSDELVSLIRRACLCGHAETAKGLWVVLRDLTRREARQRYPHGRLPDDTLVDALALEIAAAAARGGQSKP